MTRPRAVRGLSSPRKMLFGGFGACACAVVAAATVFACTSIVPNSTITITSPSSSSGPTGTSVTATGKGLMKATNYTLDFVDPALTSQDFSSSMSCANLADQVMAAGTTDPTTGDITATGRIPAVTSDGTVTPAGTAQICFISVGQATASPIANFTVTLI